jgi:putative thiamine transport system substrate-binding protein
MNFRITRRGFGLLAATLPFGASAFAGERWQGIVTEAKGQTVHFNAWAGSPQINDYITWAGERLAADFGITLTHVKLADTAEAVRRVRDEVKAGRSDGSTDLIWINGENFRVMKTERLLFGPFAEALPNFALVDVAGKPTTRVDFAEPTEGYESPWGMAQLTFFGDGEKVGTQPLTLTELMKLAEYNPGGITYPAPPDFHGTTFLKQVLAETITDIAGFARPIEKAAFDKASEPLWALLDKLHPHLWRQGEQFPATQAQLTQMMADNELLISLTFNPNEPANLVATNRLPQSTIAWQHKTGTIGNTHFLAIPVNAQAKAAAQVAADFLLSPEAQARKADLTQWGDPTVLDLGKLTAEQKALFGNTQAPGAVSYPAPAIPEPHGSWVPLIEAEWTRRYGG